MRWPFNNLFEAACAAIRLQPGSLFTNRPILSHTPILPRPHNVHSWNLDYQTAQLSQRKIQSKRGDLHLGIQHRTYSIKEAARGR